MRRMLLDYWYYEHEIDNISSRMPWHTAHVDYHAMQYMLMYFCSLLCSFAEFFVRRFQKFDGKNVLVLTLYAWMQHCNVVIFE